MASIAEQVTNWTLAANESEMDQFDQAFMAWSHSGLRTMQSFVEVAKKDQAIGSLLPVSLRQQLGLEMGHLLDGESAA